MNVLCQPGVEGQWLLLRHVGDQLGDLGEPEAGELRHRRLYLQVRITYVLHEPVHMCTVYCVV